MVEHLPSIGEALGSTLSPEKAREKKRGDSGVEMRKAGRKKKKKYSRRSTQYLKH